MISDQVESEQVESKKLESGTWNLKGSISFNRLRPSVPVLLVDETLDKRDENKFLEATQSKPT